MNAGLLQSDTEFELPAPGEPEPTGPFRLVTGPILAEEVEENAQDGVEVENRNFAVVDDPATPWDDRVVGVPSAIAFQDNGVYNIGVRPTGEDMHARRARRVRLAAVAGGDGHEEPGGRGFRALRRRGQWLS